MINPQRILEGFRIATLAPPGSVLARDRNGQVLFSQPPGAWGALDDAVIGLREGRIEWILPRGAVPPLPEQFERINGQGAWLTPGLIDCHTHLVHGGNRASEWAARLGGASYAEIARAGGGILSTVRQTRAASDEELLRSAQRRLQRLTGEGVTTVEIKSGYGLETTTELRMLKVARELEQQSGVRIVPVLLGAHAIPPEYAGRADAYVDLVCEEMIPAAVGLCEAVDLFCETIAFSVPQSVRVMEAARAHGLPFKVHAEQLSRSGIAVIAARMGAQSVDHIEYLEPEDCSVLAEHGTVAVLLPGAFYCLKETRRPPVRELLTQAVPIAVATDCNPGSSPLGSLLLAGNMACNLFGLTPEQALAGMTRHAARALGLQDSVGTLEPGKQADLAVWDVQDPAEILYGIGYNPCRQVYRRGELVESHR